MLRLQALAVLAATAGCNFGGHTGPVETDDGIRLLRYALVEGGTTKEQILDRWGVPYSAYEDDRIWTYALAPGRQGVLVPDQPKKHSAAPEPATWKDETYHLILIFEGDVLKKYRLLRIS